MESLDKDFDLIITALEFPNETGLDFINKLKNSRYKDIPVVVVSGHTDMKDEILSAGAYDYITKNISITKLVQLIVRIEKETYLKRFLIDKKVAIYSQNSNYISNWKNALLSHNYSIHNIEFFTNPEDILESKSDYSLYILDSKFNNRSIESICLKIRQRNKNSIIFGLFDDNDIDSIADFLLCGANDFIVKSSNHNDFNETNIILFIGKLYSSIRTYNLMKEIENKNLELGNLVKRDGLTKLYNHNYMYDILDKEIIKSRYNNKSLSVFMLDIDDFKNVNDKYGHQVGDLVLKNISDILIANSRETDIVGRYGGEEILIVLPNTEIDGAKIIGERIRTSINNVMIEEAKDLKVSISGGIIQLNNEDAAKIVKKADMLLYQAKKFGKNRIES